MIKSQYKVNMGNKKKILIIVIIVLMIAIFCGVFGSIVWFNNMLKPVNESSTETKKVEIEQGLSTVKIIEKLKQEELIKDELATKIFIKLNNVNSLKAGKYELSPSMSLEKILQTMVDGDVINEEITITFKEGKNIRWIAKKIAEETSNSEEDVYNKLSDREYISNLIEKYWFLTDEIQNEDIYYALEGYLFPETYTFKNKDVTVEEIFKQMLDQTDQILNKYKKYIDKTGYSVHQLLTIGSIIELEGKDVESRRGISSVIYNRLKSNMSLGSDVTTYYAIKVDMGERNLTSKELNTYNAYNTRGPNMQGKLPVGPIASVSEESIKCAIAPIKSDYLYFVADKNGKIYFSKTNDEHNKIISELKQNKLWFTYEQ